VLKRCCVDSIDLSLGLGSFCKLLFSVRAEMISTSLAGSNQFTHPMATFLLVFALMVGATQVCN